MRHEIVEGCRWSPLNDDLSVVFTDKVGAKIEIGDTLVYKRRIRPIHRYIRKHGEFVIETIPAKTAIAECVVVGLICAVRRRFRHGRWVVECLKAITVMNKNHHYRIYRTGKTQNISASERDLNTFIEDIDVDEIVTASTKTNDDAFSVGLN
jgi:hypothetical protein